MAVSRNNDKWAPSDPREDPLAVKPEPTEPDTYAPSWHRSGPGPGSTPPPSIDPRSYGVPAPMTPVEAPRVEAQRAGARQGEVPSTVVEIDPRPVADQGRFRHPGRIPEPTSAANPETRGWEPEAQGNGIASRPFESAGPGQVAPGAGTRPHRDKKYVTRGWAAGLAAVSIILGGAAGYGAALLEPGPDLEALAASQDETLQESLEAIAEASVQKTVMIEFFSESGRGTGSGFFFRSDGYILTNYHVVSYMVDGDDFDYSVVLADGTKYEPRLIGGSPSYDVAVLKIEMTNSPHFTLADSSEAKVGQSVIAVGAPLGLQSTVTTGIISAKDRPAVSQGEDYFGFYSAIQTDAAVNSGNSGGPLLDMEGMVLGINSAGRTPTGAAGQVGLNFAIQSNQVSRLAGEIIGSASGDATFPYLGAQLDVAYRGQGAQIASSPGSVTSGSPAERAGLSNGDVVVRMNGIPVSDLTELIALVRGLNPLDKLTLAVKRGGSDTEDEVEVTSGSQPTSQDAEISSKFIV